MPVSMFKYLLFICLLSSGSLLLAANNAGTYKEALDAYNKQDFTTALMIWLPLAESGDKDAQFQLGQLYMNQSLKAHNSEKAEYWFKLAANQGHIEAQTTLGLMYLNGDKIAKNPRLAAKYLLLATRNEHGQSRSAMAIQQRSEKYKADESEDYLKGLVAYKNKDYTTALMLWLPLTNTGNANAQFMIGKLYMELVGDRKNPNKAEYWFRRAAENGHLEAQTTLGLMYFNGDGIDKDLVLASKWLLKGTGNEESGDIAVEPVQETKLDKKKIAPFNLGMIAYQKKDYTTAIMLWHPLAMEGNPEAQLMLGNLYMREEGIYKDPSRGLSWYQKAISQGDVKTSRSLGLMYLYGDDIKKNSSQAINLLLKAARLGDVQSQYQLGNIYQDGKVISANLPKAAYWYEQAANNNHHEAQFALAKMYFEGNGIKSDTNKALELYETADKNNNVNATVTLAGLYRDGDKKKQDYKKAFNLYQKAANLGSAEAQTELAILYREGKGTTKNIKQFITWIQKATEQDYPDALYNLGKAYVNGYGISVNYKKGASLFERAAVKGHANAQLDLGVAYYTGKGAKYDPITAYAWFYMATRKNIKEAHQFKNTVYNELNVEDKKRASQLASEFYSKYRPQ